MFDTYFRGLNSVFKMVSPGKISREIKKKLATEKKRPEHREEIIYLNYLKLI